MKKRYFLVLLLLLLCGCENEYILTVNDDLTLNEKIILKEDNLVIKEAGYNPSEYIFQMKKAYENNSNYSNYKLDSKITKDTTVFTISQANINYLAYPNNSIINSQLFSSMQIRNKEDRLTIEATGNNSRIYFTGNSSIKNKKATVIIKSSYPVINSNADSSKNGVYKWYFDSNSTKDINITFNTKRNLLQKLYYYFKSKIIYLIGILLIVISIIYIILRSKKNNKI